MYPVGAADVRPLQTATQNGYVVTRAFNNSVGHTGLDLANGYEGGEVRAACPGIVVEVRPDTSGQNSGFGNLVRIRHDVAGVGTVYSQYGHLMNDSIQVTEGQPVSATDVIGRLDCSGYTLGTATCPSNDKKCPHLHFSIQRMDRRGCGYLPDKRCPNDTLAMYYDPLQFVADHFKQAGDLISTFDDGYDGWTVSGAGWDASAGNGYLRKTVSLVDFFATTSLIAPSTLLGDQRRFYGGSFTFDIRQAEVSTPKLGDCFLRIVGGGLSIENNFWEPHYGEGGYLDATKWHTIALPLAASNDAFDVNGKWFIFDTGGVRLASAAEIKNVLSNVTSVSLIVNYTNFYAHTDTYFIDNVGLRAQ